MYIIIMLGEQGYISPIQFLLKALEPWTHYEKVTNTL